MLKRFKSVLSIKYIIYGLSTLFGKGIEYLILLFLASYLNKEHYGEFEFYKRTIEMLAIFVSFGAPTLILSYTKSSQSKVNFLLISVLLSLVISILSLIILTYFNYEFLWLPILFYALFFYSNSIFQAFNLVQKGSNQNSLYKIIGSIVLNSLIIYFVLFAEQKSKALIYASTVSLLVFTPYFFYIIYTYYKKKYFVNIKKYLKLFTNILYGSFTLVINNFVNIAFLTTDILVIKYLSEQVESNVLVANYSFPLTIASALIIVPLTIAQVDIELVKKNHKLIHSVINKVFKLSLIASVFIFILYYLLIHFHFQKFNETIYLFIIILIAKMFQAISVPYGMLLLIKKKFNFNLLVNLIILIFNLIFSIIAYKYFKLNGIAFISLVSLLSRFIIYKINFSANDY